MVTYLRRLVTVLTGVMIVGFLVLIALFVTRLWGTAPAIPLPDTITLPDGTTPTAFTRGSNWYAVVTDEDQILIFDANSGDLRQIIQVEN